MPTDFEILSVDELPSSKRKRGPYKKSAPTILDYDIGLEILTPIQIQNFIDSQLNEYINEVSEFEVLPSSFEFPTHDGIAKQIPNTQRPVMFIDGEGANNGERTVTKRKYNLQRWIQKQNYALLGAVCRNPDNPNEWDYRYVESPDHVSQLPTKLCLDFILSLPSTHIIVGFALTYDVEMWLRDIKGTPTKEGKQSQMEWLMKTHSVWWHGYRLHYIPKKIFSVSKYKGKRKIASRTVYDAHGFFQSDFKTAIRDWNVGTPDEWAFIDENKDARSMFGPITQRTKNYNKMEGIHGVQMFEKVRSEYTKLGLQVPRPVGAGSIASAIFRKHRIKDYFPESSILPTDIPLRAFIGGRFDITRIGFVGNIIESDINSAYPFIARSLPCLAHAQYKVATSYKPSKHSVWLVRWKDNGTRWSPFPYRTENGHIRYYANGIGWYYDAEVAAAIEFDSSIEVLAGFQFIPGCEHQPFSFVEDYYHRREEMKRNGDFGEKILKLGLNSIYGKLSQSKGKNPPFQQWIWAGLITSGTRAMLMSAIRQNPEAIIKVATDAVFSTEPLQLEYDENRLGAWKTETLYDLLALGNGVYQSTGSSNPKYPNGVSKNRGFERGSKLRFDWDTIRENYRIGQLSVVRKFEFRRFVKAFHEKRLEERCDWIESELQLKLDIQKAKRKDGELLYPLPNETPTVISAPVRIRNETEEEERNFANPLPEELRDSEVV
jgi:hypothetical protein